MSETKKVRTRSEIDEKDMWNLSILYSSDDLWEKDFEDLKNKAVKLKEFVGKIGEPQQLLSYLKTSEEVNRSAEKLFIYAHLKYDEDTTNSTYQVLKNKIDGYFAEMRSFQAFFVPELLSLPEGTVEKAINELPELKVYEFLLKEILKAKPHTLSKQEEELLAAASDCLDAPSNIYGMLHNADMTFPVIEDEEGNKVELTEGNYSQFIRSKNRKVRENAFKAIFSSYDKLRNTIAASLTSSIKTFIFNAKMRNYNSALESSLKPNDIPLEVYNNAIDTMNKNLKSLHRYVKIKKQLLGLDDIHMYDLYVPLVEIEKDHIEFERAVEIINEGLKPLGEEYLSIFQEGIDNKWIDKYQNKGKRGGAYSWGSYDTMPYVLLNYNYELNDVSTLAHEMGHSIHSYYSRKCQPYIYSDYVIFCAEVASTTNESLLINHLINTEKDKNKKLYLINQELEQIRTTVFRQMMFAEFEKITHEKMEKGTPLTADDLCTIWHELNVRYFGPEMVVDKEIDIEWARIPHFYNDFYVYQYATGYAAAMSFAGSMLNKTENAVEKYIGFLKSGGSDYPINILKKAGVDMTTSKPLEDTIKRFEELLDMMEQSINN